MKKNLRHLKYNDRMFWKKIIIPSLEERHWRCLVPDFSFFAVKLKIKKIMQNFRLEYHILFFKNFPEKGNQTFYIFNNSLVLLFKRFVMYLVF